MDLFVQKARIFAQETAKKSQEIAKEAAKLSQELALETAKRSMEISHDFVVEATKKADQIKTLASELSPGMGIAVRPGGATSDAALQPSEKELEEYGITPELREFVKGLTIRTFRDFPLEDSNWKKTEKAAVSVPQVRQDLTEWQERHAVLVLMTVPEISDFRYVLCPRRMRESKFWKIYFILVQTHIAPYEARAAERAKAEEAMSNAAVAEELSRSLSSTSLHRAGTGNEEKNATAAKAVKSANADNDLDAYLMGALGSDEEEADGDDEGFDADFDKLVNSAPLDSDGEDPADGDTSTTASSKHGGQSGPKKSMGKTSAIACESSSDGELVEIPEQ
ncbi:unnamed protein product [Sphagnum jensenii]|uniref:BSD domain-containing protein n=1 Tax=Sphagnum jensenii TaxID=128206 RepID=A0ABP1AZQ0_9BRYO